MELVRSIDDHAQRRNVVGLRERRVPAESIKGQKSFGPCIANRIITSLHSQNVGDHAQRPHVHARAVVLAAYDLGGGVARRAANGAKGVSTVRLCISEGGIGDVSCESEIGNLDVEKVILAFKQNVLWLQVAMHHTLLVAVS